MFYAEIYLVLLRAHDRLEIEFSGRTFLWSYAYIVISLAW